MVEASITGLFRTLIILVGVYTLLRFIGRILVAKRNLAQEMDMKKQEEAIKKEKKRAQEVYGKTKIVFSSGANNTTESTEDIDFTELKQ
ncbi:MAG: hypothetical protein WC044_03770 [Crocinitomicaceae bacterium]